MSTFSEIEKARRARYKTITDEFYLLYGAFMDSGFTEEQAFELTKTYCHNNVVNSMLEDINKRSKSSYKDLRRAYREYQEREKTEEKKGGQVDDQT